MAINQLVTKRQKPFGRPQDERVISRDFDGRQLFKMKIDDETVASSATLQNDDHLIGFLLDAGGFYSVEGYLTGSNASATPDIQFALTPTTAFREDFWTVIMTDAGGTVTSVNTTPNSASTFQLNAGEIHSFYIRGYILIDLTTDTLANFQWAQGTSNATATMLDRGSWLSFTKIDIL
jgi:hypothetical protein